MPTGHLTPEQIVAFRDGEQAEEHVLGHLAACPKCQRALDDGRLTLTLGRPPAAAESPEHPTADQLAAYRDNALAPARTREVERHMAECRRCQIVFLRLRAADRAVAYASPGAARLAQARKTFSRRPTWLDAGHLLLRRLADGLTIEHLPRPETSLRRHGILSASGRRALGDPAVASPKDSLFNSRLSRLSPPMELESTQAELAAPSAGPPLPPRPPAPRAVCPRIVAGPYRLRIEAERTGKETTLHLALATDRKRGPVARVAVTLEDRAGRRSFARTDAEGRATLALPPGAVRLTFETDPPLLLRIDLPDEPT